MMRAGFVWTEDRLLVAASPPRLFVPRRLVDEEEAQAKEMRWDLALVWSRAAFQKQDFIREFRLKLMGTWVSTGKKRHELAVCGS